MKSIWRVKWENVLLPILQDYSRDSKVVLDIGCGPAYYRNYFETKYIGLDIQHKFPQDKYQYIRGSGYNLSFLDNSVDFILCNGVLEHIEKPEKAIKESFRIINPKGVLTLGVPTNFGLRRILIYPSSHSILYILLGCFSMFLGVFQNPLRYESSRIFRGWELQEIEKVAYLNGFKIMHTIKIGGFFSFIIAEIERVLKHLINPTGPHEIEYEKPNIGRLLVIHRSICLIISLMEKIIMLPLYQGITIICKKK